VQGFMENKLFNSCLNRKISIDENGHIGNCPSMKKKYGNIAEHSLTQVARRNDFKKVWNLNKDMIDTCRDCEFRYICSDCRAYTRDGNLYAKPVKCGYDPYTGTWND
jgi:SPASM domain peptide maturase of grasp-with-spasm system